MKGVLVVSYYFPPTGGAGVQRPVKFIKYLPEFGWRPLVLTVSNPSVPAFDNSLLADLHPQLEVVRTRTFEPSYQTKSSVSASSTTNKRSLLAPLKTLVRKLANLILQPDPQVLWLPSALRAGVGLAKRADIHVVFVSAPPFSTLLLAALISEFSGKPLVVDYRDEWDISNDVWENKGGGSFSRSVQQAMQRMVLKRASRVVATTLLSQQALATKVRECGGSAPASCIYNGFDQADLQRLAETPRQVRHDKVVLTYVGTLWNLTSIEPLIRALQNLVEREPALASMLELCVVGRKTSDQQALVEQLQQSPITLTLHDYVSHTDALQFMKDADVLLLLLSDMPVASRVMPGKTFEYLATGNAILAICPLGEVWKVLDGQPGAVCIEPSKVDALVEYVQQQARTKQTNTLASGIARDISRFERRALTSELATVLDAAARQ
jgi:glycosyltransferase involved in cell wall biosynthesis